jgi:4-coumarate--CoA ligase
VQRLSVRATSEADHRGWQVGRVAPAELEDLLISHPDVEKAGVVAEPRPEEAGEAPRAFSTFSADSRRNAERRVVVLKDPSKASPAVASDIIQFMATRTAHFKKIRGGVTFIEEMPTTCAP